MPENFFIEINSSKIFVQHAGDRKKPAIIFVHGASLSSGFWEKQFSDKNLIESFSLYAFDLPGHGQSYRSESAEDYSLKGLGKVVDKIIDSLKIKEYILVTLSIGSNMVAETLETLKGCKGIFMAGACLIGEKFPVSSLVQPFPYMHLLSASQATVDELENYAQYDMFHPSKEDVQKFVAAYQNTDPVFRNTIGKILAEGDYSDEIAIVKESGIPLALIYGKEEAVVKPLYLEDAGFKLWGNKIHLIEKAGHMVNIDSEATFNEYLYSFAKEVFKPEG